MARAGLWRSPGILLCPGFARHMGALSAAWVVAWLKNRHRSAGKASIGPRLEQTGVDRER